MTKADIEKEARVFATYYESLFPNEFETFYKAFLKVAAPREKRIEELEKACDEIQELLDKQIEATYKVVEENKELKTKYDTRLRENTGLKIHNAYVEKKLAEAKYMLNEFMWISKAGDEDFEHDYSELIEEAEKFIEEVK